MPIYRGSTEIAALSVGDTALVAVYAGDAQVWTAAVAELLCVDNNGDELWLLDRTTPGDSTLIGNLPSGLTVPSRANLACGGAALRGCDRGRAVAVWTGRRPGTAR